MLKVLAREGNTLSAIVRQAWDGEPLQTIVRNDPLRATAAHIGIVGHITRDELLRYLTATELANGFANRFLLIAVKRSKLLPFGGALDGAQFAELRDAVRLALRFAQEHRPISFDDVARERWIEIYEQLSTARPGLAGAATARAEAHTVRLALIYALLDLSERIRPEHLEAALAVWRYSAASAAWIFGDALGDPTADELWSAAKERPTGLTRTEVSELFSRNKKRREIERALGVLEDAGTAATTNPPRRARPLHRGVDPRARPGGVTRRPDQPEQEVVDRLPVHDGRGAVEPDIDPGRAPRAQSRCPRRRAAASGRSRAPAAAPAVSRPRSDLALLKRDRSARQAPDPSGRCRWRAAIAPITAPDRGHANLVRASLRPNLGPPLLRIHALG